MKKAGSSWSVVTIVILILVASSSAVPMAHAGSPKVEVTLTANYDSPDLPVTTTFAAKGDLPSTVSFMVQVEYQKVNNGVVSGYENLCSQKVTVLSDKEHKANGQLVCNGHEEANTYLAVVDAYDANTQTWLAQGIFDTATVDVSVTVEGTLVSVNIAAHGDLSDNVLFLVHTEYQKFGSDATLEDLCFVSTVASSDHNKVTASVSCEGNNSAVAYLAFVDVYDPATNTWLGHGIFDPRCGGTAGRM